MLNSKKDFFIFCITLLATFFLGVFLENQYSLVSYLKPSPAKKLITHIKRDFSKLQKEGQLPKAWEQIDKVQFINRSKLKNITQKGIEKALIQQGNGNYYLESILVDWIKNKKHHFILQLSLMEKTSKNKVWELGRTYSLPLTP